jgi:glycerol-3-phosphate dehydrogenase (NAD(P)+)
MPQLPTQNNKKISILGAGSWGSALASLLADNKNDTTLWGRDEQIITNLKKSRINTHYLPNIKLNKNLKYTTDLNKALKTNLIILATPSQTIKTFLEKIKNNNRTPPPLIITAKGLDVKTHRFTSEIITSMMGKDYKFAYLSGPTFAYEVAKKLPTATTIASSNEKFVASLLSYFKNSYFRPYSSNDIIGVQIGGALKNIYAIAAGICVGLELGRNALSALINRAMNEMIIFSKEFNCNPKTITGLSGMGDLILTCSYDLSRNRSFGKRLAYTKNSTKNTNDNKTIEGINSAAIIYKIAQNKNINMPICTAVYNVLFNNTDAKSAVLSLMNRKSKKEA